MTRAEKGREVRDAILKLAKIDKSLSVNEFRVVLTLERIVARLSHHPLLANHLVFKGGFVLLKTLGSSRFTRDLDALGIGFDVDEIKDLVPLALNVDLDDGFWFGDIRIKSLDDQGEYGALRFDSAYQIGDEPKNEAGIKKLSRIHFDVGFGDAIPNQLTPLKMPTLLKDSTTTSWRVYPPEFIFSEKLETLVKRSSANSRSKDIHDMSILFEQCNLKKLISAISQTFIRRQTPRPESFQKFAAGLDTRVLEMGWKNVRLSGTQAPFAATWEALGRHFEKLDRAIEK